MSARLGLRHLSVTAKPLKDLTEPIDIYSEWIDAADAAQREAGGSHPRRIAPSSSHPALAANDISDED